MRPWERQLVLEALRRWLLYGAIATLTVAGLVLAVGWVTPWSEAELRPLAAGSAIPLLLAAVLVAVWPTKKPRRAAELDARLGFGDRLATAWAYRESHQTIVLMQRSDAIARLEKLTDPRRALTWRPSRFELGALAALCLAVLALLVVPSPQQPVLDQRAAEQRAVQQASHQLDILRQDATSAPSLTPDQARRLDELLRQAQAQLAAARTQHDATSILTRVQEQVGQQLGDSDADTRDQALAAMSETLSSEPLTQSLGEALQHEDARAASDALKTISAQADKLSDVERSALSRALQRASNVGRSDPQTSNALKEASQAVSAGQQSASAQALSATDAALNQAIQSASAQAQLRETTQQLRDLQDQLTSGAPLSADAARPGNGSTVPGVAPGTSPGTGTPITVGSGTSRLDDPVASQAKGAGVGPGNTTASGQAPAQVESAEDVFIAGRPGNGPADQDLTDQPFTVRGEPRPYREVLGQYAQSGRDYVDRPDVSPAVRDLVKQYFQKLEEGQ